MFKIKKGYLLLETIISIMIITLTVSVIYDTFQNIREKNILEYNLENFVIKTSTVNYIDKPLKINLYEYLNRQGYNINNNLIIKNLKNENIVIQPLGIEESLIRFLKFKNYKIYDKENMVKYKKIILNLEGF